MPKKRGARKASSKVIAKTGKGKFGAKAAFVRSHPDASAKEVVALAAKAGLTLTVNHVYNIRSTSGISRRKGKATPHASASKASKVKVSGTAEAQFRRLVLDIGVSRARKLLHDIETKLAAIVAGR
jgi:hypothetical protein